jgi:hypothetical protein
MTRFVACFFAVLLSCSAAVAQSPASGSASAPAQPAVTSAESPEIREFQKIEDTWSNAVNQRDQYSLELVLSPLFVDVSASGDITTRNQQLAQVIIGGDKTLHKVNSAQADEKGVFTHVYERLRGGWVCINSQRTVLREDSNAKPKKQSNAELPFHFPLFNK